MKALGLFPADASLKDLYVQLLSSQVAGLYDPDTKTMDVVSKSGQLGPIEQITLRPRVRSRPPGPELRAEQAGPQRHQQLRPGAGPAVAARGRRHALDDPVGRRQNLTPGQLLQMAAEASDPSQTAILAAMPDDLKETLLFPYEQGLTWVSGCTRCGGWAAVDAAYANPPDSTEQILHPDKWASHEKPIAVTIPASLPAKLGSGWTMPLTDTFGELQFRIWLEQVGKVAGRPRPRPPRPAGAAIGWPSSRTAALRDRDDHEMGHRRPTPPSLPPPPGRPSSCCHRARR